MSLSGTATEATTWLLVEVPEAWGGQALAESALPASVKFYLLDWEAAGDNRRVQFIRRAIRSFDAPGRITVFIAHVSTHSPVLHAVYCDEYSDILQIDVERLDGEYSVRSGGGRYPAPIFLTCTNGRRDACCAKWGRAMAQAMSDAAASAAWQTTHLGGHRFAPTLLVLPHGSQYGWLQPDDAGPLVDAHRRGRLYRLDRYRGHVGFPRPVQAAAVFLREKLDVCALEAVTPVQSTQDGSTSQVRLRLGADVYEVQVRHEEGDPLPHSCGAAPKPTDRLRPVGWRMV